MLSAESSDITGRGAHLPCGKQGPCGCPGIAGPNLKCLCDASWLNCASSSSSQLGEVGPCDLD